MADKIDTSTAAIAALMDGVTPGPWATTMGKLLRVVVPKKRPVVVCGVHKSGSRGGEDAGGNAEANARFIAAARQLVPALAAERNALRAEVERLREALMFYADEAGNGYDVCPRDYGLSYDEGQIVKDAGERARAALKGAAND